MMKILKFLYHNSALAIAYIGLGIIGLYFALSSGNHNVFWPPSGLAVACAYVFGSYLYLGIFVGALLVNIAGFYFSNYTSVDLSLFFLAFMIACGALGQAAFGSILLHKCREFKTKLETSEDVLCFFILGGVVSSLLSSTVAVLALLIFGKIFTSMVLSTWGLWYIGDILGVLVFGPTFLLLLQGRNIALRRKLQVILPTFLVFILLEISYSTVKKWELELYTDEYNYAVSSLSDTIQINSQNFIGALYSLRSLYASSEYVEQDEFKSFTEDLFSLNPMIHSFMWVKIRNDSDYGQLLEQNDKEAEYAIPVTYIEPSDVKGLSVGSLINLEEFQKRIQVSNDNKQVYISSVDLLSQDLKTKGLVKPSPFYIRLMIPVFENGYNNHDFIKRDNSSNVLGYLLAHMSHENFVKPLLKAKKKYDLDVFVTITNNGVVNELYKDEIFDKVKGYEFETALDFLDSQITIKAKHPYYYFASQVNYTLWLILVGGLILIAVITMFLLILTGRLSRIEELVQIRTQEESKLAKFLDSVLGNIPHMVFVKDANELKFTHLNAPVEKLLGKTKEEIIGKSDYDFFPEDQADFFVRSDQEVLKNKKMKDIPEEPITDGDHNTRWLHTKKVPILNEDGIPTYLLGVSEDITEQKKLNEERELLLKELERSNKDLESFAYVASHDMQEPIRMIRSFSGILLDNYLDKLDDKGKEYLEFVYNSSDSLKELVTDLLDYSRVGRDDEEVQQCDLNDLLQTIVSNYQKEIDEGTIIIDNSELPTLLIHPIRFSRVLYNLISNAIKYSDPDKIIKISIKAEQKNNEWVFEVADNGIGIKPEYYQKIFEPFKRLHNANEYSGTGMGLAICKRIIESYNGRIWLQNNPKGGSVFLFSLPLDDKKNEQQ